MKTQISNLKKGQKFYFSNNKNLVCQVSFNSGNTLRYIGGNGKEVRYNKMPSICDGNLVTLV